MDDLISRQAAIDAALTYLVEYCGAAFDEDMQRMLKERLDSLPPAQPDIVACGDCIHWICHDRRCGYWNHGVKPLDWCCHAERRTDG